MPNRGDSDEVGFGKPPREHRFRPGQSGNPNGRPKGSKSFVSILREITSQKVKVKDQEGTRYVTKLQAALLQLANKAATGDLKAARDLIRLAQSLPEDHQSFQCSPPIVINFIKPPLRDLPNGSEE